jgi:flagellin-like hook-associated protein FlgL
MARITPIPTTRVSDSFATQRLTTQIQYDQTQLLKIQQQISTGRRISSPSEDAPAALRAISLQRLLEQKGQVKTNLSTNQTFLSATDTSLNAVANLLNSTRGAAQSVSTTVATDEQREAAALEFDRALQQLVDTGNQKFRDRFLFAGSRTSEKPFEIVGKYVRYNGNETELQSFSDIDIPFETNITGSEVFGALSEPVRGTVDINPVLDWNTEIRDLRLGQGIKLSSIEISDGTNSRIVDLSSANTLDDVRELLQSNAPAGRQVFVTLTQNTLSIALDSSGGGNLFISEVGGSTTGQDLGILNNQALGVGPLTGDDLNPLLKRTTPLSSLFGKYATANIQANGANNDLLITSKTRGVDANGYTFNFVDTGAVTAGNETVSFNSGTKTFTIEIDSGVSTTSSILNKLNADSSFNALFTAGLNTTYEANDGTGTVTTAATGSTSGGSGQEFDKDSGLLIKNGDQTYTIDFDGATTIEDLLNTLNKSPANLLATINATGTGIDIRSRLSGADFSIGENGGTTAAQLGLRTFTTATSLSELNKGLGVHIAKDGFDFEINRRDGTVLKIDLDNAKTIQDVLNLINNNVNNLDPASRVVASLNAVGNGIELIDNGTGGNLSIERLNNSQAATDLGLLAADQNRRTGSGATPTQTLSGTDTNQQEVNSVYNALLRMREALRTNNQVEIGRAFGLIDEGNQSINFGRAEIGARQQGLDTLQTRLEDEELELQTTLSNEIDTDLASAISEMTKRQAAMQASLQLMGQTARLTLLDYL